MARLVRAGEDAACNLESHPRRDRQSPGCAKRARVLREERLRAAYSCRPPSFARSFSPTSPATQRSCAQRRSKSSSHDENRTHHTHRREAPAHAADDSRQGRAQHFGQPARARRMRRHHWLGRGGIGADHDRRAPAGDDQRSRISRAIRRRSAARRYRAGLGGNGTSSLRQQRREGCHRDGALRRARQVAPQTCIRAARRQAARTHRGPALSGFR